jgi:ribonuclease BN (tRNA processing enzyme)
VGRTPRSTVSLRVLGCGDAFGSGGRFHTCFYLDAPNAKLLIDFGASALVAMHRFSVDPRRVDAVVLSHLHGDHFGGLPFLLLDAAFISRRTRPLFVVGPKGTEERLRWATEALFPGHWDYPRRFTLQFLELDEGRPLDVAGATVTAFRVIHDSGAPAFALRIVCDGRTIAYSGDTAWTDRLLDAARDADLFLCEASSFEKSIPNHLSYQTVVAHRNRFNASRIVLTHLGSEVLARLQSLALEFATDGQVFVLGEKKPSSTKVAQSTRKRSTGSRRRF